MRLGVIAPTDSSARDQQLGIDLGVDEATHAAQLFGGSIEITRLSTPSADDRRLSAIVGGGDAQSCASWAEHAGAAKVVYMNTTCTSDALRGATCSRAMFHVIPSDSMLRDAVALVRANDGEAAAWDASLTRYGADALNQRFRARFHEPMTPIAWAAWLSIKILWESALRQKSGDSSAIAEYLARDTTQFDGHKGQPLSFRSWDHQLRQPLYIVSTGTGTNARRVTEVPEPGAGPPRDALDQLGTGREKSACRFAP